MERGVTSRRDQLCRRRAACITQNVGARPTPRRLNTSGDCHALLHLPVLLAWLVPWPSGSSLLLGSVLWPSRCWLSRTQVQFQGIYTAVTNINLQGVVLEFSPCKHLGYVFEEEEYSRTPLYTWSSTKREKSSPLPSPLSNNCYGQSRSTRTCPLSDGSPRLWPRGAHNLLPRGPTAAPPNLRLLILSAPPFFL